MLYHTQVFGSLVQRKASRQENLPMGAFTTPQLLTAGQHMLALWFDGLDLDTQHHRLPFLRGDHLDTCKASGLGLPEIIFKGDRTADAPGPCFSGAKFGGQLADG